MSERRDPDLWVGIRVPGEGLQYFGRQSKGLPAITYGGQWYRHDGEDADGVWLYRRPRWWERAIRPTGALTLKEL